MDFIDLFWILVRGLYNTLIVDQYIFWVVVRIVKHNTWLMMDWHSQVWIVLWNISKVEKVCDGTPQQWLSWSAQRPLNHVLSPKLGRHPSTSISSLQKMEKVATLIILTICSAPNNSLVCITFWYHTLKWSTNCFRYIKNVPSFSAHRIN